MKTMRAASLRLLMEDVLQTLQKPHTEDVIEDVFCAIEKNPGWRKSYEALEYQMGRSAVNAWAGFWIAHSEGRVGGEHISAKRCALIDSYSRLVTGAKIRPRKKMKEPQALEAMSEYFQANKESLPATIRTHRALILELLKEGFPVADAFARALERPNLAR